MKNSNLFKKFAVMVVSAMMVITSFAMPTFAAGAVEKDDHITIHGVEEGATVYAYHVVKQDADDGKWTLVDSAKPVGLDADATEETSNGVTTKTTQVGGIQTITKTSEGSEIETQNVIPDAEKIAAIAKTPGDTIEATKVQLTRKDDGTYQSAAGALAPGVYVVTATANGDTIYNPMVVSIDYTQEDPGPDVSSNVDAANHFQVGTTVAYAKSSSNTVKKTTLDAFDRYEIARNANGFTVKFDADNDPQDDRNAGTDMGGATLPFKVVTTIPSYASNYDKPQFILTDKLGEGFKGYHSKPVVLEEDTTQTDGTYRTLVEGTDYWFVELDDDGAVVYEEQEVNSETIKVAKPAASTYTNVEKQTFAIAFKVDTNQKARKICVQYDADMLSIFDDEGNLKPEYRAGFDPYTNEVSVEYTKNSNDEDDFIKKEDCTHHYTFNIDGSIGGGEVGREIIKVAVDEYDNLVTAEKEIPKNWKALEGAEFKIYKVNADGTKTEKETIVTDAQGEMNFIGLDAGDYVIKETKAPAGYALNDTEIPIKIEAAMKAVSHKGQTCHVLDWYKVSVGVNEKYTNTYTATYDENGELDEITKTSNEASIKLNTDRVDPVSVNPSFTAGFVNTKSGTLPSTGGIGTVVFTVGGIAIMALALFLLFGAKKKEQE